jgi:hypothetical protein
MGYQIEKTGETAYAVKKADKVCMRVSGPVEGPPPRRKEETSKGPDVDYTMAIAARAVRYVRKMLPFGAFNNQMLINGEYKYLTQNVAPKWLAARAETMYVSLAYREEQPRDTVTQMAARSLATRTVKGGVCSLMTYVTAGYLTTIARQGTKIVTVFDKQFDHEYVVLYYGTSPYVVADPWVGKSYVCLWGDCSFPPDHVSVHTLMEIEETLSAPYGVEFPTQEVRIARRIGDIDLIVNPPENQKLLDLDKQSLDKKNKYSWFHMDSAYAHPDNIKPNARKKYKSVVEPEEWGNAVGHTLPTHKNSQKSATDWAHQAATMFPDEIAG